MIGNRATIPTPDELRRHVTGYDPTAARARNAALRGSVVRLVPRELVRPAQPVVAAPSRAPSEADLARARVSAAKAMQKLMQQAKQAAACAPGWTPVWIGSIYEARRLISTRGFVLLDGLALTERETLAQAARRVVRRACDRHGLAKADVVSKSRAQAFVHARWEIWWRLKRETTASLTQIGHTTGGHDHSSVMYGVRQFGKWLERGDAPGWVLDALAESDRVVNAPAADGLERWVHSAEPVRPPAPKPVEGDDEIEAPAPSPDPDDVGFVRRVVAARKAHYRAFPPPCRPGDACKLARQDAARLCLHGHGVAVGVVGHVLGVSPEQARRLARRACVRLGPMERLE